MFSYLCSIFFSTYGIITYGISIIVQEVFDSSSHSYEVSAIDINAPTDAV